MKERKQQVSKLKCALVSFLLFAFGGSSWAQKIVRPSVQSPTTFAIIIDSESYRRVGDAVNAYRGSIEREGLGTYIAIADWQKPDDIRTLLRQWHEDEKQPLEGAVFVGDIPIPMIRDGQYLTSAFKMNQSRDWRESSVASDRFYDDFGLQFDFLKQDADKPLYFYYSLSPASPPYLQPTIYSGRIKPTELPGVDKYDLLEQYLRKVVRIKSQESDNVIDHFTMARGHSYNSDDKMAWAGEQIALREQMPQLFRPGGTVKFYDFDVFYPTKGIYLNEIQSRELDILLFHHHGSSDTQYLNGYKNASDVETSKENIKLYLRSKLPRRAEKVGRDSAILEYSRAYDVPVSWCAEAFDPEKVIADSLFNASLEIRTSDIHRLSSNARFVLFDACFNGSFYEEDYTAGAYIFNDGNTVVTIGGTVNALQDKWPDEFIGLLAAGMRVGHLNRMNGYLESHVIGDPTFRFADNTGLSFDLNQALALHDADADYWLSYIDYPFPDVQSVALAQLRRARYSQLPALLRRKYFSSDYFVVRMEAVKLLALYYPEQSTDVLASSINDSYELIRRLSLDYISRIADPMLIPAYVSALIHRGHEPRLNFRLLASFKTFDTTAFTSELSRQLEDVVLYTDTIIQKFRKSMVLDDRRIADDIRTMHDKTKKHSVRRQAIFGYRNYPCTSLIPHLLSIAADESEDVTIRHHAIHTLGWYNLNYRRRDIVDGLRQIQTSDESLRDEMQRTIGRLYPD